LSASPLAGARIAVTGARKAAETADFVRRLGGEPLVAPVLSTVPVDAAGFPDRSTETGDGPPPGRDVPLDRLLTDDVALVIFLTGVGARTLFRFADERGQLEELRAALGRTTVVARGPKALGALKGAGIKVAWMPTEATVAAILAGLDRFEVAGRVAVIQWSGFVDERLRDALTERGADVIELDLYRHVAPEDEAPVLALVEAVCSGTVDFLTFTSAIGVRGFFAIAEQREREDEVLAALRSGRVIPVAVGPVTAAALAEAGAPAPIVPDTHTTGGMLRAIEHWLANHPHRSPIIVDLTASIE
jgi:uroporphyrinogen-III synthase